MTKAIFCDCGLVCRGESDEDLLREAQRHLREEHAGLTGVRPEDLLAMAVEVPAEPRDSEAESTSASLVVARDGAIATVTLNRPRRRNALSLALIHELGDVLTDLGEDSAVRGVILAGAGSSFCSGHDLTEMRGCDEAAARALFEADTALMRTLHQLPVPVIARVHGPATAAGCHLVAACDLAIASPEASFAVPGPALGLVGTTAMVEVGRLIGRRRAMQMLLSGASISAETALSWGLVNAVVPAQELSIAAQAMAVSASSGAPGAVAEAKRGIYENLDLDLDAAYRHAGELTWRLTPLAEAQEGISAFIEKRPPSWSSRAG